MNGIKKLLPVILAITLLLLSFFLVGCSSLPPPDKQKTSLFIVISENPEYNQATSTKWKEVISLEGPTAFNIEVRPIAWRLNFYKLKPGNYRISKRYIQFDDGSTKQQVTGKTPVFEIMPKTITLSPVKVRMFEARAQAVVETVTPDDQRRAVKEVSDYLNFGEWIGSDIQGFGPYRPRFSLEQNTYTYTISTTPEKANVVIDRVDWGTAPVAAELVPGKHLVLVQMEDYADTRTFIDVESDGEITLNLTPLATTEKKKEEEKTPMDSEHVNLLLVPLQNMGGPEYERLVPIFPDIIRTGLSQDKRLTVFDYPEENLSGELTFVPDFSYAEKNGIDLLISGQFLARDEELLVNAALYDVRSEMVKTSLNYTGRVGLSMFNAIDAMTEEFTRNVAKVLPEAGKDVFEETDEIKSQVVAYDKKRTEKDVIQKRLERIFSLSLNFCWGAIMDTVKYPWSTNNMRYNGPALGLGITSELTLGSVFSLALSFNPVYQTVSQENGGGVFFELPLYFGPRFSFLGYRNDLYFGLLGQARFVTPLNVVNSEMGSFTSGPYLITGLGLDTGLKLYTYDRMSKPPTFVNIGMIIGLAGVRFNLVSIDEREYVPFELWLYIGFGSRL